MKRPMLEVAKEFVAMMASDPAFATLLRIRAGIHEQDATGSDKTNALLSVCRGYLEHQPMTPEELLATVVQMHFCLSELLGGIETGEFTPKQTNTN